MVLTKEIPCKGPKTQKLPKTMKYMQIMAFWYTKEVL